MNPPVAVNDRITESQYHDRARLLDIRVEHDSDIVLSRRISSRIARLLDCTPFQQSSLGAAVSDVVRAVFNKGKACSVLYFLDRRFDSHTLQIQVICESAAETPVRDGIAWVEFDVDDPEFAAPGRFVDRLDCDLTEMGSRVTLTKKLSQSFSAEDVLWIRGRLKNRKPGSLVEELQLQNQELIRALETYQARYRELLRHQTSLEESHSMLLETTESLKETAARDPLTGLFNRLRFKDIMQEKLYSAAQTEETFAMILFDVDDFKAVNDGYGHSAGDRVLVGLADVVALRLRQADWFFRIGGEEFVIFPSECDLDGALCLARQLCRSVEEQNIEGLGVTCSFGVSAYRPGDDYHALFDRVDAAMYRAKKNGKNRVAALD